MPIVADATVQAVGIVAAVEPVVAPTAGQIVGTTTTFETIVAFATIEAVVTQQADEPVVAPAPNRSVVVAAAFDNAVVVTVE